LVKKLTFAEKNSNGLQPIRIYGPVENATLLIYSVKRLGIKKSIRYKRMNV